MTATLQTILKCITALALCWMSWHFYMEDADRRRQAENVRSAHEVEKSKYDAERTKEMVSLFTKTDKPIERFGCPVEGLYQKVKGKNGKITSKRIC
jgi:cation transport regulator ChaB